jgi:hypothetical protein
MVVTVAPISVVMTPSPGAWRPNVIGAAYVIASAPSIVWPISNVDRDGARTITSVVRSVSRITTIIISAPACTKRDRKQKE